MMNGTESLYKLIPKIRRTRDYHLYDFNGRRYLDICLDGGRALLGHKPGRTGLMMKNALDKGLSAPYPGVYSHRLLKQLRILYPRIAACSVVFAGGDSDIGLYRPFEEAEPTEDEPFELLLPLPGSGIVRLICASERSASGLPAPNAVPPFLLSGLCRAAAELAAFRKSADTAVWDAFDSPLWQRQGPWLRPRISSGRYPALFRAFIERGILISPDYEIPSCAPYLFTEGEIKPIREIEREFL